VAPHRPRLPALKSVRANGQLHRSQHQRLGRHAPGPVIVGRLIPADTGMQYYRNVQLSPELEEAAAQVQQEVTAAIEAEERELEQMRMEANRKN
jgi:hypothetical protein